jgi:hypothetical protein
MCNPVVTAHPDLLLAKGVYGGYEWEVTSNRIGYRCGYVRVPLGHPWHGKDYDDVRTADGGYPDVHGGLTFAEPDADCGKGGEDSAWWLGFDCAHAGDAPDPELHGYDARMASWGVVRTTEYVAVECWKLARQAADAAGYHVVVVPDVFLFDGTVLHGAPPFPGNR